MRPTYVRIPLCDGGVDVETDFDENANDCTECEDGPHTHLKTDTQIDKSISDKHTM